MLTAGIDVWVHGFAGHVVGRLESMHSVDELPALPGFAIDIDQVRQACKDLCITRVLWISYQYGIEGTVIFVALELGGGSFMDLKGQRLEISPAIGARRKAR